MMRSLPAVSNISAAVTTKQGAHRGAGVWAAAVAVEHELRLRGTVGDGGAVPAASGAGAGPGGRGGGVVSGQGAEGLLHGVDNEVGAHVVGQAPADDFAGAPVEHDGEVELG